ncbi:MAG: YHYH protein, partial [Candidatus Kariarchaeaceae archaeon]
MIQTGVGVDKRVQVQQLIDNQLPEFILSESPKAVDFLKQYYISQEYQGGPTDLADNLDQYLKLDNLTPEVITGSTTLSANVTTSDDVIQVASTKGFPDQYGLFKIDNEIITYTGSTTTSFTGCIRGFSGVTNYRSKLNPEELVFEETNQAAHTSGATVTNLSSLFLKEFYKKLKYSLTPGLEDVEFASDVDVNNFIKQARDFYQAKGTEESFRILFNVLYGVNPKVTDLENYLIKPSSAKFLKREIVVAEAISGEAKNLIGQTIRKSSDPATQAPVSEVEVFARPGVGTFYRLYLFVGYDNNDLIEGTFTIQPKTRVIETTSVGSSTITVDSTIGFANSGTLISGNNTITYTDKTINQFLGCSGITEEIASKSDIRNDEYYYGYENGDTTKEVRIRLTGVLSKYESIIDNSLTTEGEKIYVKNVGERILNPEDDKSYKQIFANSWIYNTSTRFDIESISGSNFVVKTDIDKSQLSVGDKVDILNGITENVVHSNATVSLIDNTSRQVVLSDLTGFSVDANQTYTFRRNLKTASSSGTPIAQGNNVITSDIQNVYNEDNKYMYAASNSLPSYEIDNNVKKSTITSGVNGTSLLGYNQSTEKYSIISFPSSVPFLTGDEVYYSAESDVLDGLEEKTYFVKVLSPNNRVSLHAARSLIDADIAVEFKSTNTSGSHSLTLNYQKEEEIYPQKLLKKFPLQHNIKNGTSVNTEVGSVGMLINGVEVLNYKSLDKVYYGPVKEVKVYNKGKDYDVLSAPSVTVDDSIVSSGTTALVQPVISGSVKEVLVDPQNFDIQNVSAVSISGGNGSGAVLQPILEKRNREVFFNPK